MTTERLNIKAHRQRVIEFCRLRKWLSTDRNLVDFEKKGERMISVTPSGCRITEGQRMISVTPSGCKITKEWLASKKSMQMRYNMNESGRVHGYLVAMRRTDTMLQPCPRHCLIVCQRVLRHRLLLQDGFALAR